MSGRPLRPPWAGPLGLYRPGSTPLHRAPVWAKLTALGVFSLAVVLVPGLAAAAGGAAVAGLLAVWARVAWRAWRGALVLALLVGGYQAWATAPAAGIEAALDLFALLIAGTVLVTVTRADALLDALPGRAGLAAVLMLRAVPALARALGESRDAARARGAERDPRTWLTPAAVRAVAGAHTTGEALAARGLADTPP